MKPVDFSRQTFAELKPMLDHVRREVHCVWLAHGPGTTREVAAKGALDILTLRPRTTELYQLGLLELIDRDGHNGVYRARTIEQWESFVSAQRAATGGQLMLAKI